jgi:hypothetical protein
MFHVNNIIPDVEMHNGGQAQGVHYPPPLASQSFHYPPPLASQHFHPQAAQTVHYAPIPAAQPYHPVTQNPLYGDLKGRRELIRLKLPGSAYTQFTASYKKFIAGHHKDPNYLRAIDLDMAEYEDMVPLLNAAKVLEDAVEEVCPRATKHISFAGYPQPEINLTHRTTVDDFARVYNWLIDLELVKEKPQKLYRKGSNKDPLLMANLAEKPNEAFLNVTATMMREAKQDPKAHPWILTVGYEGIRQVFKRVRDSHQL